MRCIGFACLLLLLAAPMRAGASDLDRPDAFEHGFAVSLYLFDACGDPLAGRMFRRALAEKFAHCPFSPDARARYLSRTRAQQAKMRRTLEAMIETRGGLPVQLDGMAMTCHQQQASDDYRQLRGRLEAYVQGGLTADAIIAAPCDAPDMAP
jgi:hypothetical protein